MFEKYGFTFFGHYWGYFLIILAYWLFFYIGIFFINKIFKTKINLRNQFLIIIGFSYLSFTIGILVGLSRTPVVDVAIPALLTFIGGLVTYIFLNKEFNESNKNIVTLILVILPIFLIFGVEIGAEHRFETEEYLRDREEWINERIIDLEHKNKLELHESKDTIKIEK